jgi:hypothetical protein
VQRITLRAVEADQKNLPFYLNCFRLSLTLSFFLLPVL